MPRIIHLYLISLLLIAVSGCGDDDTGASDSPVGQAGSGSSSATLGKTSSDKITCGAATCSNLAAGNLAYLGAMTLGRLLPPCCVDAKTARCGYVTADRTCEAAPPVDRNCPMIGEVGLGGFNPCCTAAGECGAGLAAFGRGCVPLSDEMLRKVIADPPAAQRCDGKPL